MSDRGNPIAIVCATCGSKDVSRDAWADWDEQAQGWVLRQAFDDAHCHVCDGRTALEEVPLGVVAKKRDRGVPSGPRLELFAREERKGWTAWGNQAEEYEIGWETYAHNSRREGAGEWAEAAE